MASAFPKLAVVFAGFVVLQGAQVPQLPQLPNLPWVQSKAMASDVALQPTQKSFATPASCMRSIVKNDAGKWSYSINRRAHALQLVALDLYGSVKKSDDIARWNKLESPYPLKANNVLVVLEKPLLSEARANTLLAKAWMALGNKARADCVQGQSAVTEIPTRAAVPSARDTATDNATDNASNSAADAPQGTLKSPTAHAKKQESGAAPAALATLPTPVPTPQDDRLGTASYSNSNEPVPESLPSDDALSKVLGGNSDGSDEGNEDPLLEK